MLRQRSFQEREVTGCLGSKSYQRQRVTYERSDLSIAEFQEKGITAAFKHGSKTQSNVFSKERGKKSYVYTHTEHELI